MKAKCKHCKCQREVVWKLGGMVCIECRVIIHAPHTLEYKKAHKALLEHIKAKSKV